MPVCRFFRKGNCRNGDSCRFEHFGSEKKPDVKPNMLCKLFLGDPNKDSECPYIHATPQPSFDSAGPSALPYVVDSSWSPTKPHTENRLYSRTAMTFGKGAVVLNAALNHENLGTGATSVTPFTEVVCSWTNPHMTAFLTCQKGSEVDDPIIVGNRTLDITYSLRVDNIKPGTSKALLKASLPKDLKVLDIKFSRSSHCYSEKALQQNVYGFLNRYETLERFEVLPSRKPKIPKKQVLARFSTPKSAQDAVSKLDGQNIDPRGDWVKVKHAYSFKTLVSKRILQLSTVSQALRSLEREDDNLWIKFIDAGIRVCGSDQQVVARVMSMVRDIVGGHIACHQDIPISHSFFFSPDVENFIADVEAAHSVIIVADKQNTALRLYGEDGKVTAAEHFLAEQATILEGQTVTTPSVRPQGDIACVSCLDTLEESFTTECGHTYCGACLKFQCESASTYPIRCIGAEDTCKTALELRDLRKALPGDTYEAMLRTSFTKHVRSHRRQFRECSAGSCDYVYSPSLDGVFYCDGCLQATCKACNSPGHLGWTCSQAKDGTVEFNEWLQNNDCQQCPNCTAYIQKVDGCNHVECASCHAHMCWLCVEQFEGSKEVYRHLMAEHGDFGNNAVLEQVVPGGNGNGPWIENVVVYEWDDNNLEDPWA